MAPKIPRGIRNNNPLNIRIGNDWIGEVDSPTDPAFEQFREMKWGLRAAFIILKRYIERYHRDTIRKIVYSWAPQSENDSQAYAARVAALTGLNPDEQVGFYDYRKMCAIVAAMAYVENGRAISDDIIFESYNLVAR